VGRQIAEPLVWHKGMPEAAAAAEVARLLVEVGIPNPRRWRSPSRTSFPAA
jgi:ABC-type microcin C transport system duplicated ATPase subunit YejF